MFSFIFVELERCSLFQLGILVDYICFKDSTFLGNKHLWLENLVTATVVKDILRVWEDPVDYELSFLIWLEFVGIEGYKSERFGLCA